MRVGVIWICICCVFNPAPFKMSFRRDSQENKIIIRSYPPDTTDEDLRIMFEKYGKIDDRKNVAYYVHSCSCEITLSSLFLPCSFQPN